MPWRPRTAQLFSPDVLHAVARGAVGLPHDKMVRRVTEELERLYPGHIERRLKQNPAMVVALNRAGGES